MTKRLDVSNVGPRGGKHTITPKWILQTARQFEYIKPSENNADTVIEVGAGVRIIQPVSYHASFRESMALVRSVHCVWVGIIHHHHPTKLSSRPQSTLMSPPGLGPGALVIKTFTCKNSYHLSRIFNRRFWLAGSTIASHSEDMLEHNCSLTWMLIWIFIGKPGHWIACDRTNPQTYILILHKDCTASTRTRD